VVVLVGLAAACLLAAGFVLQQHEAAGLPDTRLRPGLLLVLLRRPVWLAGIAAMIGGQVLGAIALGMGSLVVVEPLLATNILFALPLAALSSRARLSGRDWIGAVLVVGGLVVFLVGLAPGSAVDTSEIGAAAWALAGGCHVVAVVVLLLVARGRRERTCAALTATAAGVLFGLQDFLTQRSVMRLGEGAAWLLTSWPPWVLLIVAISGLTLAQRAFGLADLSASLPAITLAEPVGGIALSVGVLGQRLPNHLALLACTVGGLVVMVAGVVLLTRSPLVVDSRGRGGSRRRSGAGDGHGGQPSPEAGERHGGAGVDEPARRTAP